MQNNFKDEYIENLKKVLLFMQANLISVVWLCISLFIATIYLNINSYQATFLLFLIVALTLLPTGDTALKWFKGIRKVETKKDIEYLLPIFNEVYSQIKRNKPELPEIVLCTTNSMEIAVQGLGKNTLFISKGAIEIYSENDIKGLIAREIGRITEGHTKGLMLNDVANRIFIIVIALIKIASWIYEIASLTLVQYFGFGEIFLLIFLAFEVVFTAVYILIMFFVQICISINNKSNNHIADKFAFENGYGAELINCLYSIRDLTQEPQSFWKRLKSGEAMINKRIALLEAMEDIRNYQ